MSISAMARRRPYMRVTAQLELVAVEGRKLRFKAWCRDEREIIGTGYHERASSMQL